MEDFKQFLPESAAAAKAQAAQARQAAEEAPAVSNVRSEPGYTGPPGPGQPPAAGRTDVKMPPLGQFNVKETGKDNRKRRPGPSAQGAGPSTAAAPPTTTADSASVGSNQANRAPAVPASNVNKVS